MKIAGEVVREDASTEVQIILENYNKLTAKCSLSDYVEILKLMELREMNYNLNELVEKSKKL